MGRKKCKAERKRHTKNVTSGFCMLVLRVICFSSCFFSVFSKFSKEAWNYFYNHFFFKLPHEWTVYWEIPTAREEMGRCSIDAENEREAKEEECIFLPGQQWVGCWSIFSKVKDWVCFCSLWYPQLSPMLDTEPEISKRLSHQAALWTNDWVCLTPCANSFVHPTNI